MHETMYLVSRRANDRIEFASRYGDEVCNWLGMLGRERSASMKVKHIRFETLVEIRATSEEVEKHWLDVR